MLESRLSAAAEKHGWRAEGQAGFRPDKSTVDQVFILRHLIEATQLQPSSSGEQELFCCFVDFRKAYDKVRRDLLLQRLAELGVHGSMLQAVAQMYWECPLIPKQGQEWGEPIDSTCGVKQGDPLSPLLFGLFIDELESWLCRHVGREAGVRVARHMVHMLLYADDLVLMSRTKEGLQQQLDALASFCQYRDMEVNLSKTEIVVFRPASRPAQPHAWQWQYNGQPVTVSQEFRYLGIIFHETGGVRVAITTLAAAARRAMWAMLGRIRAARIVDISMKLQLFRAVVAPIMEYCSGVWGPDLLFKCSRAGQVYSNELQQVQNTFLRHLGRLRTTVPTAILHKEFGMQPVATAWIRSSLQLWERMRKGGYSGLGFVSKPPTLLSRAAVDCLRLAEQVCNRRKHNWASRFMGMLGSIAQGGRALHGNVQNFVSMYGWSGAHPASPTQEWLHMAPMVSIWSAWETLLAQPWEDLPADPRAADSLSVKYATYQCWFAVPRAYGPEGPEGMLQSPNLPRYVQTTSGVPGKWLIPLIRLRTGGHHLAIETGRWSHIPRQDRVCEKCDTGAVEDEAHVLFECPAYAATRAKYVQTLFSEMGGVDATRDAVLNHGQGWRFMEQEPRHVAHFVYECMQLHDQEGGSVDSGSILEGSDVSLLSSDAEMD